MKNFYAIYDFRVAPLTFDFVTFLGLAYLYFSSFFQKGVKPEFSIVLFRPHFRNATNYEQEIHSRGLCDSRFENIVIGVLSCVPVVKSVHICRDISDCEKLLKESIMFPPKYDLRTVTSDGLTRIPCVYNFFEQFAGSIPAHLFKKEYFAGNYDCQKQVSLSLRNSFQKPERECNLDDWFALYQDLEARGLKPIVIPDHDDAINDGKYKSYSWKTDLGASCNIFLRLKRYSMSQYNIASPSGMNTLLFFSDNSFYVPGYLDSRYPTSSPDFMNRKGPKLNTQLFWFRPDQKIGWEEFPLINKQKLLEISRDYIPDTE